MTNEAAKRGAFALLFLANFFNSFSTNMYQANFAQYLARNGFGVGAVSVVVATFPLAVLLMSFVAGRLTRRFDLKALLLVALALLLVIPLLYAFVPADPAALFAIRLVHGAASGLTMVLFMAVLAQIVPTAQLASRMGIFGIGGVLGQAMSPFAGIAAAEAFGYQSMFLLALIPMTLALAFTLFGVPSLPARPSLEEAAPSRWDVHRWFERRALFAASSTFLLTCATSTVMWYLVSLADEKDIAGVSAYFLVQAGAVIAARLLSNRRLDRWNLKVVLVASDALMLAGMVLLFAAGNLATVLLAGVLLGAGSGTVQPSLQAEAVRHAPPERRGIASSTFMTGASSAFTVGSYVAGMVAGAVGFSTMFLLMGIPILLAAGLALARRPAKDAAPPPVSVPDTAAEAP